jgi:hypothetical protein
MNVEEAVARACAEPTLEEALSWIAVWEADRAIGQALRCERTGQSTAAPGQTHDTCFRVCFKRVLAQYRPEPDVNRELPRGVGYAALQAARDYLAGREEGQEHSQDRWGELKAWLVAEQQAGLGNSYTRPYRRMARQTLEKMATLEKA